MCVYACPCGTRRFVAEVLATTVPGECFSLASVAQRLDVERRRMYDVVNIFDALDILKRRGKNQYFFIGFGGIHVRRLCARVS